MSEAISGIFVSTDCEFETVASHVAGAHAGNTSKLITTAPSVEEQPRVKGRTLAR
jgi:hypothetical protein